MWRSITRAAAAPTAGSPRPPRRREKNPTWCLLAYRDDVVLSRLLAVRAGRGRPVSALACCCMAASTNTASCSSAILQRRAGGSPGEGEMPRKIAASICGSLAHRPREEMMQ